MSSPACPELESLRESARRFCTAIKTCEHVSVRGFLDRMNQLLPELYWLATCLPGIDADTSDEDLNARLAYELSKPSLLERYGSVHATLEKRLAELPSYHHLFDPVEGGEVITSEPAVDLFHIYDDLSDLLYDDGHAEELGENEAGQLWRWRFSFQQHWGPNHLMHVLPAISWLLYRHLDVIEGAEGNNIDRA